MTTQAADPVAYTAICEREGGWWVVTVPELESGRVTQARSLDEVPAVVADLVATMTGVDASSVEVDVKAHARPGAGKFGLAAGLGIASAIVWRAIKNRSLVR